MSAAPWVNGVISSTRPPGAGVYGKVARWSRLASQRASWVWTIALGRPVVPEVKMMRPQASPGTGGNSARPPGAADARTITDPHRLDAVAQIGRDRRPRLDAERAQALRKPGRTLGQRPEGDLGRAVVDADKVAEFLRQDVELARPGDGVHLELI